LVCSTDLDYFINEVCEIADAVKAKKRSKKTITLSLDEWNVWNLSEYQKMPRPKTWEPAIHLIEDEYDVADAVVLGNLMISILRRSDRVKLACLAQLVNVIAPIRAEVGHPAWRQTTFFPFSYTARYGRGKVLKTRIDSPMITTDKFGSVTALDAVTTYEESNNSAAIFLVNRSLTDTHTTEIELAGFSNLKVIEQVTLTDKDLTKTNTLATGEQVKPLSAITAIVSGTKVSLTLQPASWQMVRLSLEQA
jgi:alpha-N-arabinofuranosidase